MTIHVYSCGNSESFALSSLFIYNSRMWFVKPLFFTKVVKKTNSSVLKKWLFLIEIARPMFTLSKKEKVLFSFVLIAALTRLVPHPPNFAPITAMSLFAGAYFTRKQLAFIVPLLAMLISDLFLGFYTISIFVYLSFAVITWMGQQKNRVTPKLVLLGSVLFFLISNLGVWLLYYPKTIDGLVTCFALAVPFFTTSLLGDIFYSVILVFGFSAISRRLQLS